MSKQVQGIILQDHESQAATLKVCTACKQSKPIDQFYRQRSGKFGRHSYCKVCYDLKKSPRKPTCPQKKRATNLRNRYGITDADVQQRLVRQGSACAICEGKLASFHIDHDHATGKVRGLLCMRCNVNLPIIEDERFRVRALAYLERAKL